MSRRGQENGSVMLSEQALEIQVNPLLPVAEARERLLASFTPLPDERVSLSQAAGRVLVDSIHAEIDLPLFDNSSMDGFAVRAEDTAGARPDAPIELIVIADQPAGATSKHVVSNGETVRIMTGAPLPKGADAVIPVEDTDYDWRHSGMLVTERVKIYRSVVPGENVRSKGQDIHKGEPALEAGLVLRPQDLGLLAMLGVEFVRVYRRPLVAVLATGDELLPVGSPLEPGKIYDSNSYMLSAMIEKYHGLCLPLGIVPDRENELLEALQRAVEAKVDLILTSAGVSVGAFDFVRNVVERYGRLEFWRVNMRPGKPIAYGAINGVPFIGLPGNPVSAFVGFEVFVRPILYKMGGYSSWDRPMRRVRLAEPIESDGRETYFRAVVRQEAYGWVARLASHQGSGNLLSLVRANALLMMPSGVKSLPSGAEINAWMMDEG